LENRLNKMTLKEFALKYPEVVKQVQNLVFPCSYKEKRVKDAKHYVELLIEDKNSIIIDMFAVQEAENLYNINDDLFMDYKNIRKDLNILLQKVSREKNLKNLD